MLQGFTPPYTPDGRSSLVVAPPWHYAGQVVSLRYDVDRDKAQRYIPDGFGTATGTAYLHACEWQSTSDGWELLDPAYAQYREIFVLIEVQRPDGALVNFCPLIWVDQDVAMLRGLLQGWPKKMGEIAMTRSYDLDHPAAAASRAGSRIAANLSEKGRRLVEIKVTLDDREGRNLGVLAQPTFSLGGLPSLEDPSRPADTRLLRALVRDVVKGPMRNGTAEVQFFDHDRAELSLLSPEAITDVSFGMVALSIDGAASA